MGVSYTIGALARAAAVPTTTLRYYERRGLLRSAARSGSGHYRSYGEAELEGLRFIRAAQASGFALGDVETLLALRDGRTGPCREVQDLIENRLSDLAARLNDLARVVALLLNLLAQASQRLDQVGDVVGHLDRVVQQRFRAELLDRYHLLVERSCRRARGGRRAASDDAGGARRTCVFTRGTLG